MGVFQRLFTTETQRHREKQTKNPQINLAAVSEAEPVYLFVMGYPHPLDLWNDRLKHVLARKIRHAKDLGVKI
jgi:hypothetical protein